MASTKQSGSTRGAITDTSAPPFATKDGRSVVGQAGTAPPLDPSGRSGTPAPQPGHDFIAEPNPGDPSTEDRQPLDWGNPAQVPGRPELRVDAASIATGGIIASLQPGSASRSSSDPGPQPSSLPFKNLK